MRKILSAMRRAIQDYNMISPGDKIAVGISGGKDSLSLLAALAAFSEGNVVLLAGGYDKHIPYDELGPEICKHVKKLFLCGATAPQIRAAVENCPMEKPEMVDCGKFEAAVKAAAAVAESGDVVLMSPASASFDEFKNFAVRGNFFKKLIMEL